MNEEKHFRFSDCCKYLMWIHDGKIGTDSCTIESPCNYEETTYSAIMKGKLPDGRYFSFGKQRNWFERLMIMIFGED